MLKVGRERAEQRGTEHQAGDELPHHRRLLEPQHRLPKQTADQDQQQQLRDEQKLGRAFVGIARGGGKGCARG